jgi:hypothetical protein
MTIVRGFFALAGDRATLAQGVRVALVVGTVLNAINQGDRLWGLRFGEVIWWRVALTYLVPFCVSVYAATRTRMRFAPGCEAWRDARLSCDGCRAETATVERGATVPACPRCGPATCWQVDR